MNEQALSSLLADVIEAMVKLYAEVESLKHAVALQPHLHAGYLEGVKLQTSRPQNPALHALLSRAESLRRQD